MTVIDVLNKLLGDPNKKELKKLAPIVGQVRAAEKLPAIHELTLGKLPAKTQEFRDRYARGESLEVLLPEAFAVACRACGLLMGKQMTIGT